MGERTSYPPGSPCWVDVSSSDVPRAAEFYSSLFGWDATDLGEDAGHYTMFDIGGQRVAALGPKTDGDATPAAWTMYVTVTDVDATLSKIEAAGGSILMPSMDVFDAGRMGIARDPLGGVFALWQPGTAIGAELVNAPNTWCWSELTTRNADELLTFYSAVFGCAVEKLVGDDLLYREIQLDGRRVAGCIEIDDNWPPDLPTHWMNYFAVEDCDAAAAKVGQLGGTVHMPPTDIPVGRFSVVQDPTGAVFSVIKLDRADE